MLIIYEYILGNDAVTCKYACALASATTSHWAVTESSSHGNGSFSALAGPIVMGSEPKTDGEKVLEERCCHQPW